MLVPFPSYLQSFPALRGTDLPKHPLSFSMALGLSGREVLYLTGTSNILDITVHFFGHSDISSISKNVSSWDEYVDCDQEKSAPTLPLLMISYLYRKFFFLCHPL